MKLPVSERTRTLLKRGALILWVAVVVYVVIWRALQMDWSEVLQALSSFDVSSIVVAFALGMPGFIACAGFDLIGRRATGHQLPVPRVMLISYTGYFFSLNLCILIRGGYNG